MSNVDLKQNSNAEMNRYHTDELYRKQKIKTTKERILTKYHNDSIFREKFYKDTRKWKSNNKEKVRESNNKSYKKRRSELRLQIFTLFDNKCSNPYNIDHSSFEQNENYIRILEIDHINDNGNKERKTMGDIQILKRVLEYPEEYQLLCPTCNRLKTIKNIK